MQWQLFSSCLKTTTDSFLLCYALNTQHTHTHTPFMINFPLSKNLLLIFSFVLPSMFSVLRRTITFFHSALSLLYASTFLEEMRVVSNEVLAKLSYFYLYCSSSVFGICILWLIRMSHPHHFNLTSDRISRRFFYLYEATE